MSKSSTGPTSLLKRCPYCKEMVRVRDDGRLDEHKRGTGADRRECKEGSGYLPDPAATP